MKASIKEKIYLCVTVVCIGLCVVMIAGMCFNKSENISAHLPAIRNGETLTEDNNDIISSPDEAEQSAGQIAVTEGFLNEQLERFLPDGFPVKKPEINIGADGIITFSGVINREALKSFLKENDIKLGLKYRAALLLLPSEFSAEASLKISEDEKGMLKAEPFSLFISGKRIPVFVLPQKISDILTKAVNDTVSSIGGIFDFSGFEDGAILFQKS